MPTIKSWDKVPNWALKQALLQKIPPTSGMQCPWNQDASGPAKQRIWCYVWKNHQDFAQWGGDNNHDFCRKICHYGKMDSEQRQRSAKAHKSFLINRRARQSFARKIAQFKLPMPQIGGGRIL